MVQSVKKRPLTLIEVMVVIFIIGIIGSVAGLKIRKSLEKGKAFKTEMAMNKLYDIIAFEDISPPIVVSTLQEKLKDSEFVRNPSTLLKDGWGSDFQFTQDDDKVEFYSQKYVNFCEKTGKDEVYPWDDGEGDGNWNYPWKESGQK